MLRIFLIVPFILISVAQALALPPDKSSQIGGDRRKTVPLACTVGESYPWQCTLPTYSAIPPHLRPKWPLCFCVQNWLFMRLQVKGRITRNDPRFNLVTSDGLMLIRWGTTASCQPNCPPGTNYLPRPPGSGHSRPMIKAAAMAVAS
jgi:hypothetical protein